VRRRDFFKIVWSAALALFLYRREVRVMVRGGWILREDDI
jgi:hypothetical protein